MGKAVLYVRLRASRNRNLGTPGGEKRRSKLSHNTCLLKIEQPQRVRFPAQPTIVSGCSQCVDGRDLRLR